MQIPVVMLGANFYTALGAIRTLGRHHIPVYALDYHFPSAYALSSRYVTQKIRCPNVNTDESDLANFLVEMGKEFKQRPILMATADNYALLISRYAQQLSSYYIFPDTRNNLLEKIIDKKGLAALAKEHDLQTPQTFIVDSSTDLPEVLNNIYYPAIIKPALSHKFVRLFRQKCLPVNNQNELKNTLETVQSHNLEVMVQQIIPGFDDQMFVFDVYINQEGRPTHTFTGQKLRQFPINFGSSTLTRQVYIPELVELGLEYMQKLEFHGYGEIEFKKNPNDGKFYMIEINARLSTLNVLFDKCGVEFTYVMYRDLIGNPLPDYHLTDNKPWVFWHAYEDFLSSTAYLKQKQLSPKAIIMPWLKHHKAHAIWAHDDIKPLFSFARLIIGKVVSKLHWLITRHL
ncbi:MAG: carboxylate--amine ligase [Bacillota bacterium]